MNTFAKLTAEQTAQAAEMLRAGQKQSVVAAHFSCDPKAVWFIAKKAGLTATRSSAGPTTPATPATPNFSPAAVLPTGGDAVPVALLPLFALLGADSRETFRAKMLATGTVAQVADSLPMTTRADLFRVLDIEDPRIAAKRRADCEAAAAVLKAHGWEFGLYLHTGKPSKVATEVCPELRPKTEPKAPKTEPKAPKTEA